MKPKALNLYRTFSLLMVGAALNLPFFLLAGFLCQGQGGCYQITSYVLGALFFGVFLMRFHSPFFDEGEPVDELFILPEAWQRLLDPPSLRLLGVLLGLWLLSFLGSVILGGAS